MERLHDTTLFSVGGPSTVVAVTHLTTVVGQEEQEAQSVNIRNRDDVGTKNKGAMMGLVDATAKLLDLKRSRRLENKLI